MVKKHEITLQIFFTNARIKNFALLNSACYKKMAWPIVGNTYQVTANRFEIFEIGLVIFR